MRFISDFTLAVAIMLSFFSSSVGADDNTLYNLRELSMKLDTLQGEPRRQLLKQISDRPNLVAIWAKHVQILNGAIENRLITIDKYVAKGQVGFANEVATNVRPLIEKTTEITALSSKVVSRVIAEGNIPNPKIKAQILRAGAFITANSVFIRTEHYGEKSTSDIKRMADMDQMRDKNDVPRGPRTRNGQSAAKRLSEATMKFLVDAGVIERWSKIQETESFKFKTLSAGWIKVPPRVDPLASTGLEPFGGSGIR